MRTALASLTFDADPNRHYKTPAERTVSFIFDFGVETKLGAKIVSAIGQDFEQGTSQSSVRMEFWADDPWTDVVVPGAAFTIWYGGDIGHGVIEALVYRHDRAERAARFPSSGPRWTMGPVPTIEKQPMTQTQSLIFVLCGMAVAFVGLARLTSGSGADPFLGAAMLMVGNWMVLPQLIALAASRNR